MSFQGLVNYWDNPSMSNHGGSDGSATFTSNKWWGVNRTPGKYYIGISSSGLSAFVLHKNNPIGQIGNFNNQLSNPRQSGTVKLPEGNTAIILQPMVNPGSTGTISRIIVIDSDKLVGLQSVIDEDMPYFDYKTMPITIK